MQQLSIGLYLPIRKRKAHLPNILSNSLCRDFVELLSRPNRDLTPCCLVSFCYLCFDTWYHFAISLDTLPHRAKQTLCFGCVCRCTTTDTQRKWPHYHRAAIRRTKVRKSKYHNFFRFFGVKKYAAKLRKLRHIPAKHHLKDTKKCCTPCGMQHFCK